VGLRALFGDANPYGWPTEGTVPTVTRFTLSDVQGEHKAVFRPEVATLLVAGDITPEEARPALDKACGDWKSQGTLAGAGQDVAVPARNGMRVLVVDRPDAVQTVIRFITPGPKWGDDRRVPLRLVNTILGGSFTSRLNQNLREQHGYAYGARSRFSMEPSAGYFTAGANVKADVTGASLQEFQKEFARIRAGDISPEETTKASEMMRTDVVQSFQSLQGLLGVVAEYVLNSAPYGTLAKDMSAMQAAKAPDLNALTNPGIPLDQGVLVLVGDKDLILAQIKDLGLPTPVEVRPDGSPRN